VDAHLNLVAAWIGFLAGVISGIVPGLLFHGEEWMGGYGSWRRRLTRLGHISFFGIGFLNLAFALTARSLRLESGLAQASVLFITGAVSMPLLCYLSAWKKPFRHLFFIPVLSLAGAIAITLTKIWPS
jgi:uncharacterized membrane protein YagU involved in acid resistance